MLRNDGSGVHSSASGQEKVSGALVNTVMNTYFTKKNYREFLD
jgi:hypothetical protein